MKTIGRTNEGNYLLEISEQEYSEFSMLALAVEGKSTDEVKWTDRRLVAIDFGGVFGAIRAYALARFRINDLRQFADTLEATINHA